ncbi:MAG: hypothetical protein WDW36_004911 [Sanguina aurantia]
MTPAPDDIDNAGVEAVRVMPQRDNPSRVEKAPGRRFASWQEHHFWSAGASFRRLASRPLGSLLTVAVMGVALALPLAFYLLLGNVQKLGETLGQSQAISVFMQPDQSAQQAQMLGKELGDRAEVASAIVKTPQEGMDELSRMQGFTGAMKSLDDNPLPYVVQLQPRQELGAPAIARLVADIRGMHSVEMVQDSGAWRQRLDALLAVGNRAVLVLASLLTLAALLVVGNTVRVDIVGRSEEIGADVPEIETVGCGSGADARRLLDDGVFDFVTTALRLPDMDGLELAVGLPRHGRAGAGASTTVHAPGSYVGRDVTAICFLPTLPKTRSMTANVTE